jgi:hypothetical protein
MKRLTLVLAAASAVLVTSQTFASDSNTSDWKKQPLAVKRQMVAQMLACMKKRMYGDRLITYNQASKLCRDEVQVRVDKASAGLLAADTGQAK